VGEGLDSNGNGFSNAILTAAGCNLANPASTPTGSPAPATPSAITLKNIDIKLDFKKASEDSISVEGEVPLPSTATMAGQMVVIDVGANVTAITLDSKGKSPKGDVSINIGKPSKSGLAAFSLKMEKGSFQTALANYGLTNKDQKKATTTAVPVIGGIASAYFLKTLFGTIGSLGATLPGKGVDNITALALEIILTTGLVNTILGTASGARNIGANGAIAVGGYIALAGLWAAPISGASMNPIRSLAPDFVRGDLSTTWIYIIGPIIGALIGVIFEWILKGKATAAGAIAAQGTLHNS
jgi:hypothetical protein